MQDNVVQPWGPRPLIRSAEDPVLVLKYLEYNQAIRFPQRIQKAEWQVTTVMFLMSDTLALGADSIRCHKRTRTFSLRLSTKALVICKCRLLQTDSQSHFRLVEDDKQLLWSNRDALRHIPKALPLVLASSFSWDSYSLSNIYPLLDGWAELPPATAIELLLP